MKKQLFFVLSTFVFIYACSPEKTPENIIIDKKPHQLSIGSTNIVFGAKTDLTASVSVTSDNTRWEFSNIPTSWLSVTPSSGSASSTVNMTAQANPSVDERRIQIMRFSSTEPDYSFSQDVSVSQAAAEIYITPQETSYGCEAAANIKSIVIDSNVEWEATCGESWITLSKNANQLNISVTENLGSTRIASISLKQVGMAATISTITVTQGEAGVTSTTETVTLDADGKSKEVEIVAGASWTAYTSEVSWLSVTPTEGKSGTATIAITATANTSTATRNGFVYVKIKDNVKLAIPVHQENMRISIENEHPVLDGEGKSSYQLAVISNSSWKLYSEYDWLTVTPDSGEAGTTNLTVSAEKNPLTKSRQGNFAIGVPNTNLIVFVSVLQKGLNIDEDALYFGWSEHGQTLTFSTPSSWSAMKSVEWITLSQYSGTGAADITVTAATNDSEDERSGTISFVTEGTTKTIPVYQEGQYLKIDQNAGIISAMKSTVTITVSTTVGAQSSVEYSGNMKDWIQVSNQESNVYELNVSANPSRYSRIANFYVNPLVETTNQSTTAGVKYTITQSGRSLSTNVKQVEMLSKGGSSSVYTIQAHGEYSIQKNSGDTWYVLQHDATANTFSIIASENTTKDKREGVVTLSLQNMPEGESYTIEIPIIQFPNNPLIEGFGEDKDWN